MIVYTATNTENGKSYVGQTSQTLRRRFYKHSYDAKNGSDALFHRAIRKYGLNKFDIQQVFETSKRDSLNNTEKLWVILLQAYNPIFGYNLTAGGEGGLPTEEVREKMRQAKLTNPAAMERVHQLSLANRGRKASKELRQRLREVNGGINNGFFGKTHTDESKRKISETQKNRFSSGEAIPIRYWKDRMFSDEHKFKLKEAFNRRPKDIKGRLIAGL